MSEHDSRLLGGRILAASALWSLAAQVIPAIVGVVAIPIIVRALNVERFGVLTLAWMVIGYFSLFDLGLGRAVTKFTAERLAFRDYSSIDPLLWTAWSFMLALGIASAVILTPLTPWLVKSVIHLPPELQRESLYTFYLLDWSIPIVILTAGFRGLLEAAQRFGLSSLVKVPTGVLTFIVPLLVIRFTSNLAVIVLLLIVVRLVGAIVYAVMCNRVVHHLSGPISIDRGAASKLLRFGAWMTVSNVISPLMVSVDRFFVGAFLSITAVAYYATPFEAVTRLLIIPSAVTAVLFPAFSAASMIDRRRMADLFRMGMRAIFISMYPIVFFVITFAPQLLKIWLGVAFALQSASALRWLAFGVLMNSLASLPFALLQGVGRSDTTAKIHLVEAPLYLIVMVWLIRDYGIVGAAIAWSARTAVDLVLLYWYAEPELRATSSTWRRDIATMVALTPALCVGVVGHSSLQKGILASILAGLFAVLVIRWTPVGLWRTGIAKVLRNR